MAEIASSEQKFFTKPLIIIFVTVLIDLIGFGIVIPVLPYYANTEPFSAAPREIGFLVATYSVMQFIFSPILGRLSDRYGRRPVLFISLLGSAAGYAVIGFAATLPLVFLGRIISGVTGGNISTAQAYIADVTSVKDRAKGMGLFGAAFGLGFILGPAIAGLTSKYGIHVPFFIAAALSLVNAIALYFFLPESLKPSMRVDLPKRKNRITEMLDAFKDREFREINIVYFLLVTAFSIMTYAFVLYTAFRFGFTAEQNGFLFAFVGIIAVIVQGVLIGRLVKIFGESKLVIGGCLIMAASLFAIPIVGPATGGMTMLIVVTAALAFGNSAASPSLTSLASRTASEHDQGRALGILQSGGSLARAVGPVVGGLLLNNAANAMDDSTLYRTFWAAAGIMLIAFGVAFYFSRTVKDRSLA
ncbi:MAG TPA: MFS transporter [Pyrinomonadaceae bacterium]|jgi:DHA1 family tetracycline resistance protein-like MFS transporter|nr:MFS transporter [Pyrinomonadaceae bacterium]